MVNKSFRSNMLNKIFSLLLMANARGLKQKLSSAELLLNVPIDMIKAIIQGVAASSSRIIKVLTDFGQQSHKKSILAICIAFVLIQKFTVGVCGIIESIIDKYNQQKQMKKLSLTQSQPRGTNGKQNIQSLLKYIQTFLSPNSELDQRSSSNSQNTKSDHISSNGGTSENWPSEDSTSYQDCSPKSLGSTRGTRLISQAPVPSQPRKNRSFHNNLKAKARSLANLNSYQNYPNQRLKKSKNQWKRSLLDFEKHNLETVAESVIE